MSVELYRRRLPHLRSDGATYFVTWRLEHGQAELTPDERSVVASTLRHFDTKRYELLAYVIMNDHVHVLVHPLGVTRLQDVLHSWKSYTANRFQDQFMRVGRVWQEEYFDRIMRDEAELMGKVEYILHNPRKRWPEIGAYEWVWVRTDHE